MSEPVLCCIPCVFEPPRILSGKTDHKNIFAAVPVYIRYLCNKVIGVVEGIKFHRFIIGVALCKSGALVPVGTAYHSQLPVSVQVTNSTPFGVECDMRSLLVRWPR